jgi:hypothetical protein
VRLLASGTQVVAGGSSVNIGPYTLNAGETPQISVYVEDNVVTDPSGESFVAAPQWWSYVNGGDGAGTFRVRLENLTPLLNRTFRYRILAWSL